MSFWARTEAVYYAPVFYVGVMTDPTDIATFQYIDTIEVDYSNTNWDLYPVNLEDYNGYGEYIAIRANRPDTGQAWVGYIDDIHLDNVPVCRRVRNVDVHHITTNSATLSWTRGGRETSWELIVGDSVYYATDTFYTVSTLDSNTFYDVTVRAICGEGISSTPSHTSTTSRTSLIIMAVSPLTTMPSPPAGGVSTLPRPTLTPTTILISFIPQLAQFMATTSCTGNYTTIMITTGTSTPYCLLSTRIYST